MSFTDLSSWNPSLRLLWITLLVILWVGATIANIATVFGLSVNVIGLVSISVFIGAQLVRSLRRTAR